jgi:hypothetical protein
VDSARTPCYENYESVWWSGLVVNAHHVSALGLDERSKMRNEVIVLLAHPKGGLTGQSRCLPPSVVLGDIYTYVMG